MLYDVILNGILVYSSGQDRTGQESIQSDTWCCPALVTSRIWGLQRRGYVIPDYEIAHAGADHEAHTSSARAEAKSASCSDNHELCFHRDRCNSFGNYKSKTFTYLSHRSGTDNCRPLSHGAVLYSYPVWSVTRASREFAWVRHFYWKLVTQLIMNFEGRGGEIA